MNELLAQLSADPPAAPEGGWSTLALFGHSIAIGILLMLLTWWVNLRIGAAGAEPEPGRARSAKGAESDLVLSSSNVLFLCIGMTTVMILVNNSLARAFAVAAAIALVRFRVKVAGKFLGIALFYGVLTGMACGVNRVEIAWGVAITFAVLLNGVLLLRKLSRRRDPAVAAKPDAAASPDLAA